MLLTRNTIGVQLKGFLTRQGQPMVREHGKEGEGYELLANRWSWADEIYIKWGQSHVEPDD